MLTRLPAVTPDGQPGERIARFVGVDGPAGSCAASSPARLCSVTIRLPPPVEEVFRTVVVDRGDDPRPPRELLPT